MDRIGEGSLPGCPHCDVTSGAKGDPVHEVKCPLSALRKIAHILKQAGIEAGDSLGNAIGEAMFDR